MKVEVGDTVLEREEEECSDQAVMFNDCVVCVHNNALEYHLHCYTTILHWSANSVYILIYRYVIC
jgi:hypothetical protein